MSVKLVKPEPVEDVVQITISKRTAAALQALIGRLDGASGIQTGLTSVYDDLEDIDLSDEFFVFTDESGLINVKEDETAGW